MHACTHMFYGLYIEVKRKFCGLDSLLSYELRGSNPGFQGWQSNIYSLSHVTDSNLGVQKILQLVVVVNAFDPSI